MGGARWLALGFSPTSTLSASNRSHGKSWAKKLCLDFGSFAAIPKETMRGKFPPSGSLTDIAEFSPSHSIGSVTVSFEGRRTTGVEYTKISLSSWSENATYPASGLNSSFVLPTSCLIPVLVPGFLFFLFSLALSILLSIPQA